MGLSSAEPFVAASWPIPLDPVTLRGNLVRLAPLSPEDIPELASAASHDEIWTYLTSHARTTEGMRTYVADLLAQHASGTALPFTVRLVTSGEVVGATRLKDVVRAHRRMGIGSWLTPSVWGKGVNVEAKMLLFEYAFETLGALRVELETDSRNSRSRAALQKLGLTEEGVLRSHRITRDGRRRDSVVFSVLDFEWLEIKRDLQRRV